MSTPLHLSRAQFWVVFKWAAMSSAVFWMVVYQLSQQAVRLPEFVYVNF